MKPVLTFALGALLASAVAVFVMKRSPDPVQPATTPVAETAVAPTTAAPEPVPVHETPAVAPAPSRGFARTDSRPARAPRPSARTSVKPAPAVDRVESQPAPTNSQISTPGTTSTAANPQGGPPQTTISMPPPPAGSQNVAESKPPAPVRIPKTVTIPAGTLLNIRVDEKLSSNIAQTGDSFRATLDSPLVVDGAVVAEKGARVEGRISESDRGGKVRGTAALALELVRLNTSDGQRVRLQTEGFTKAAERSTKKDAMKVGIGAGLGAAIGAIAGGGKGAAIGAGVGGAAGTGTVMATRGEAAEIPAETRLAFRLREPITITEKLN
jgi:hypothetical protein